MSNTLTKTNGAMVNMNIDDVVANVVTRNDFVTIDGRVEITRDLALKLAALARFNIESHIEKLDGDTYIVRVRLSDTTGRYTEALGACDVSEISGKRSTHDAITRAETCALKRALECAVGLPFINEIINRLFGTTTRVTTPTREARDGATRFWSRVRELGVPREHAVDIVNASTDSGRTNWDVALSKLNEITSE